MQAFGSCSSETCGGGGVILLGETRLVFCMREIRANTDGLCADVARAEHTRFVAREDGPTTTGSGRTAPESLQPPYPFVDLVTLSRMAAAPIIAYLVDGRSSAKAATCTWLTSHSSAVTKTSAVIEPATCSKKTSGVKGPPAVTEALSTSDIE